MEKRKITELLMRYKLEPDLRDVYVEGFFDREVLMSAMSGLGMNGYVIYPIDSVEVNSTDLTGFDLSNGNKQRVIALALKLAEQELNAKYLCLVDRDLDHWFDKEPKVANLKWTKYCCIESHFIREDVFRDIAVMACKIKVSDDVKLFGAIVSVLKLLYSLRLADYELELNMAWVPFAKYLIKGDDSVSFDFDRYVNALLQKNCKNKDKTELLRSAKGWGDLLNNDHRLCIRGHDFTDLLAWVVMKFNGVKGMGDADVIPRLFVLNAKGNAEIANELYV